METPSQRLGGSRSECMGRPSQGLSISLVISVHWDPWISPGQVRTADIPFDIFIIRRIKWVCKMGPNLLKFFYTAMIYEARNSLEYSLDLLRNILPQESTGLCEKPGGRVVCKH